MNQSHTSTRIPKSVQSKKHYVNGRLKTVRHVSPSIESVRRQHIPVFHTQQINSVPSAFFSGTGKCQVQLDPQIHRVRRMFLKIDIEVANAGQTAAPVWSWFERISVRANGGSSGLFDYHPADVLPLRLAAYYAKDKSGWLQHILPMLNAASFSQTQTNNLPQGSSCFYLPLYGWEDVVIEGLAGDICFDLYSAGILPAASALLTGLSFVIETDQIEPADRTGQLALMQGSVHSRSIMEAMPLHFSNRPLAAGSEASFDLDAFTGSSVGLLVCIRDSSGAPIDLGSGQCDVENASGRSILGQGSLVEIDHLKTWSSHFGHTYVSQSPNLVISFTDALCLALTKGVRSGQVIFRAQKDRLVIKPGPGFPSASYNVTIYSLQMKRLARFGNRLEVRND